MFWLLLFQVDKMLAEDIAKLMTMIPLEESNARSEGKDKIEGGAFDGVLVNNIFKKPYIALVFRSECFLNEKYFNVGQEDSLHV